MSASLTATGRDFHAWFAPRGFPSSCLVFSCIQKLWADVLASLRSKLRGVCDAFSAILVHVCGSCDICGLLSVCGGTADDSESDWWRFFFFLPVVWLKKRENCLALYLLLLHFPFSYFPFLFSPPPLSSLLHFLFFNLSHLLLCLCRLLPLLLCIVLFNPFSLVHLLHEIMYWSQCSEFSPKT